MSVSVGDAAPQITLSDAPGNEVSVDWSQGPTVILFFPLAFSGVCQEEFCTIRDDWAAWTGLNAKVYGISIDSCFVVAKFRELERTSRSRCSATSTRPPAPSGARCSRI